MKAKDKSLKTRKNKLQKRCNWVGALFMWPFKLFPIKKNRIYFQARYGQQFNCNPRAFFEFLYKNYHDDFEFVWCLNDEYDDLPKDVKRAKFMSIKDRYYIHTSKYVINNNRFTMLFSKRKKQIYILAVHGAVCAVKFVELESKLSYFTRWNALVDNLQMDALLSASKQEQDVHGKAFGCEDKTYITGYPRSDQLINGNDQALQRVKKFFNIGENDYVIFYGPTFREGEPYIELNNPLLKEAFEKATGKNVKILYHFHPRWKKENIKHVKFCDYVINATPYPEFQDLLLLADIYITDLSSAMFDMMVTGKLCIQDRSNEKSYLDDKRHEFHISMEILPFPSVKCDEDYVKIAENLDEVMKVYHQKSKKFYEDVGCVEDGHSCERVYALMLDFAKKKEK